MDNKKNNSICRALISISENETEVKNIIDEFTAIAIPTDNKQLRYSFENEEYFYQVLRTGQENIKIERLDSGLPLFDNHPEMEDAGALNQLGITVGYEFLSNGLSVVCRLGARADDCLRSDIKNQIVKTVSIEGDVEVYSIERKQGEIPIYYAELWQPTSLSFAPVPQDISAQIEVKRAIAKQLEPQLNKSKLKSLINKF